MKKPLFPVRTSGVSVNQFSYQESGMFKGSGACMIGIICWMSNACEVRAQGPNDPAPRLRIKCLEFSNAVRHVTFNPVNQQVAVASKDSIRKTRHGDLHVYDSASGDQVYHAIDPNGARSVQYSTDGTKLFVSNSSLLDAANFTQLAGQELESEDAVRVDVRSLSSDGRFVMLDAASSDLTKLLKVDTMDSGATGITRFWNINSWQPVGIEGTFKGLREAGFSPDGNRTFVIVGKTVVILDPATGMTVGEPFPHSSDVWEAVFMPDSRSLVTANTGGVTVWDLGTGKSTRTIRQPKVGVLALAPDGATCLAAGNPALIWDLASGKQIGKVMARKHVVEQTAFTPDGQWIVTAGFDIRLWDAARLKAIGKPYPGYRFALSADGRTLATWRDNEIQLWDMPARDAGADPARAK